MIAPNFVISQPYTRLAKSRIWWRMRIGLWLLGAAGLLLFFAAGWRLPDLSGFSLSHYETGWRLLKKMPINWDNGGWRRVETYY